MFVNREDGLAALRWWWQTDSTAALVWGRRRVGKTALLQHFAADRPAVFHTGAGRPAGGELAQLSLQVHHMARTSFGTCSPAPMPTGTTRSTDSPSWPRKNPCSWCWTSSPS